MEKIINNFARIIERSNKSESHELKINAGLALLYAIGALVILLQFRSII